MTYLTRLEAKLSTSSGQLRPGRISRRDAMTLALLTFTSLKSVRSDNSEPLVVVDGWVVKESEVRRK